MKIKYELNNAHVCHDNVCFKIPFVLIKNMTDKVILGLPFINALYPFLVEHDGITTDPFGQKVKFKFASKTEVLLPTCQQIYVYVFWKARLCLDLLIYGSNISKHLLLLLFLKIGRAHV